MTKCHIERATVHSNKFHKRHSSSLS